MNRGERVRVHSALCHGNRANNIFIINSALSPHITRDPASDMRRLGSNDLTMSPADLVLYKK